MFSKLNKMCKPAVIYFVLSMITLLVMVLSNLGNNKTLNMGSYECPVDNLVLVYVLKLGYILFATIILDSLCKNGYKSISWFLVFFPLFAYFASLALFMLYKNSNIIMISEGMAQRKKLGRDPRTDTPNNEGWLGMHPL